MMITVSQAKNALKKLEHMENLKEYQDFMNDQVRAILLAKFLNDEIAPVRCAE